MSKPWLTVLGDSFVEGRGDPAADGSFRGWVPRLADLLTLPATKIRNFGTYEATTQDVVDRQLAPALAGKAPLIGVVCGVNDLVSAYDERRFARNLQTVFSTLAGYDTTVFTASYPDIPGNLDVPRQFRELLRARFTDPNRMLAEVARRTGTLLLDLNADTRWAEPGVWSPDGLHPGPDGHQLFAHSAAELIGASTGMPIAAFA